MPVEVVEIELVDDGEEADSPSNSQMPLGEGDLRSKITSKRSSSPPRSQPSSKASRVTTPNPLPSVTVNSSSLFGGQPPTSLTQVITVYCNHIFI